MILESRWRKKEKKIKSQSGIRAKLEEKNEN